MDSNYLWLSIMVTHEELDERIGQSFIIGSTNALNCELDSFGLNLAGWLLSYQMFEGLDFEGIRVKLKQGKLN